MVSVNETQIGWLGIAYLLVDQCHFSRRSLWFVMRKNPFEATIFSISTGSWARSSHKEIEIPLQKRRLATTILIKTSLLGVELQLAPRREAEGPQLLAQRRSWRRTSGPQRQLGCQVERD